MSNKPTQPAPAPEPNRIFNVSPSQEVRSAYWGMDARQVTDVYLGRLRAIKIQMIGLLLVCLFTALLALDFEYGVLYLASLVCVPVIVVLNYLRTSKLFGTLGELVSRDCDPARYRAVLEGLAARDRKGRSAQTIALELAYCDFLELDAPSAIGRVESLSFKRKNDLRWFRAMQIEFLSRLSLGDMDGARDAMARLLAFRRNLREGSGNRVIADTQVADYALLLRPAAERDAADAARMRDRMMLAEYHQQRAQWQLYLAEYELLHGSAEEAERLAADPSLDPLTPRMGQMRHEVLAGLRAAR